MDRNYPGADTRQQDPPWQVGALVGPLMLWALVHAVRTRTLEDFVRYPLYFFVPVTAIALFVAPIVWWKSGFRRLTLEEVGVLLLFPFGAYLAGAFYYAIGASLKDAYYWVQSPTLSKTESVAAGIALTLLLGVALFFFRLRLRSVYGATEACAGLAVAAQRVASEGDKASSDPGFYLAVLTAGVYLVVRGLDNVHQGITKEPRDPIASRLASKLSEIFSRNQGAGQPERSDAG